MKGTTDYERPSTPELRARLCSLGFTDIAGSYTGGGNAYSHGYIKAGLKGVQVTIEFCTINGGTDIRQLLVWVHYPDVGDIVAVGIAGSDGRVELFRYANNTVAFDCQALKPPEYDNEQ